MPRRASSRPSSALALAIIFVVGFHLGGRGVLLSQLVAELALCAYLFPVTLRGMRLSVFSRRDASDLLIYGLALVPAALLSFLIHLSDRYFLKYFVSVSAVGIYALGYRFGEILYFAILAFELAYPAFLFSHLKNPDAKHLYSRVCTYYFALMGTLWLCVSLPAEEIVTIMAHPAYHEAYRVIPWIAGAFFFQGVGAVWNIGMQVNRIVKWRLAMSASTAVLALILNFALIPRYGMMGAAWAALLAFLYQFVIQVLIGHRLYPIPYEWGRVIRLTVVGVGSLRGRQLDPRGDRSPPRSRARGASSSALRSCSTRSASSRQGKWHGSRSSSPTSVGAVPPAPFGGASMDRRARVLFIIDELDIGGTEQQILELVKRLDRRRYVPDGLPASGPDASPRRSRPPASRSSRSASGRSSTCASSRASSALMRRERIDLAQTYLFTANTWATAGGDHRPRPVIVTSERNVDMWEERFKPTIGRWLDRCTHRTIGNSQAVKDYLVRKGLAPDKVHVIYNGVDPERFEGEPVTPGVTKVGARHPSASLGGRPPRPSGAAEGPPDLPARRGHPREEAPDRLVPRDRRRQPAGRAGARSAGAGAGRPRDLHGPAAGRARGCSPPAMSPSSRR